MPVTATITFCESWLVDDAENIASLLHAIEGIVDVEVHENDEDSGT